MGLFKKKEPFRQLDVGSEPLEPLEETTETIGIMPQQPVQQEQPTGLPVFGNPRSVQDTGLDEVIFKLEARITDLEKWAWELKKYFDSKSL